MEDRQILATRFRSLHEQSTPLLLPNPWDAGTAKLLEHLGFKALATTSLGAAISIGKVRATMDELLSNCRAICESTELPVTADLENGHADDPAEAARCVTAAYDAGAVGASIEDSRPDTNDPIYDFNQSVERVAAAVETAHACEVPMVLTARAERLLFDPTAIDDTIRRLQAYEAVGADVLYAPYIVELDLMKLVVDSVTRPVNVVMGFGNPSITIDQLRDIGVSRISIGGALCRYAMHHFLDAAREMARGEFGFVQSLEPLETFVESFKRARG